MKSTILVTIMCSLFCVVYGQEVFTEQFDSGSIPTDWTIIQAAENWSCEKSLSVYLIE